MEYYIAHVITTKSGEKLLKYVPSTEFEMSAEYLLNCIENEPKIIDLLLIPFILTLSAGLEANLNDWIIISTYHKHGSEQCKPLIEGYLGISFPKKLRVVVAILTDNTFQLREESNTVKVLDQLIKDRNKITHSKEFYRPAPQDLIEENAKPDGPSQHLLHKLTLDDLRRYYKAFKEFDEGFFKQYDHGYVVENQLIRELKRVGKQVPPRKTKNKK